MKRIIIIGCSGSGKSTLARRLASRLSLPLVHLDKLYWRENWQPAAGEEFDALLLWELEKPEWVMDGNFSRTLPLRLARCDTAVYLDYPRWLCLFRVLKRVLTHYGRTRPDMGENCPERLDFEFLKFIWNYNRENKRQNEELLSAAGHVKVVLLHNPRETERFLLGL